MYGLSPFSQLVNGNEGLGCNIDPSSGVLVAVGWLLFYLNIDG